VNEKTCYNFILMILTKKRVFQSQMFFHWDIETDHSLILKTKVQKLSFVFATINLMCYTMIFHCTIVHKILFKNFVDRYGTTYYLVCYIELIICVPRFSAKVLHVLVIAKSHNMEETTWIVRVETLRYILNTR
jgi:hypothetical protein